MASVQTASRWGRGEEGGAWHGTRPVPTPSPFPMCCLAVHMLVQRQRQQSLNRLKKYADIINGVDFVPVAIETSGIWGQQALDLVSDIGRRITAVNHALPTASLRCCSTRRCPTCGPDLGLNFVLLGFSFQERVAGRQNIGINRTIKIRIRHLH